MPEFTITVQHAAGLHARPLAKFVQTANKFEATLKVTNLTREKGPVEGKSPLQLLLLAVLQGHTIKMEAQGPDADEMLAALKSLIENNFGETESS